MIIPEMMKQNVHLFFIITININIDFILWSFTTRFSWFNMTNINVKFLGQIGRIEFQALSQYWLLLTWKIRNARTSPVTWFFNENIIALLFALSLEVPPFSVVWFVVDDELWILEISLFGFNGMEIFSSLIGLTLEWSSVMKRIFFF